MNKNPLVSILMNCFNGEAYLDDSIKSIIKQTYTNWELIFWDNQSTDKSLEIISSYDDKRIKIFKSIVHTNLGKARKNGFQKAKGDILAFLDVDDFWYREKLSSQIKDFYNCDIGISFTNSLYFSEKQKKILYNKKSNINLDTKSLITNYPISLNSVILNIEKIKKLNYDFDSNFSHISDFDLIVRLSQYQKSNTLIEFYQVGEFMVITKASKKKAYLIKKKTMVEIHLRKNILQNSKRDQRVKNGYPS